MAWWYLWRQKPARVLTGDDQTFDGRLVLTDDALYVGPDGRRSDGTLSAPLTGTSSAATSISPSSSCCP